MDHGCEEVINVELREWRTTDNYAFRLLMMGSQLKDYDQFPCGH